MSAPSQEQQPATEQAPPTVSVAAPSSSGVVYTYGAKQEYVNDYWKKKYEQNAGKYWDAFYKKTRGWLASVKERNYLIDELGTELVAHGERRVVLEVGCGAGHSITPLLQANPQLYFFAMDISPRAVSLIADNEGIPKASCTAFVCDLATQDLPESVPPASLDCVLMVFVLSAISPERFRDVTRRLFNAVKPGGLVFVRDYGEGDENQLSFDKATPPRKLAPNFYVRPDGTRAFFFSEESLRQPFEHAGFDQVETKRIFIEKYESEGRVFIQTKFMKHVL